MIINSLNYNIQLTEINNKDNNKIYEWYTDDNSNFLWTNLRELKSFNYFNDFLSINIKYNYSNSFMIKLKNGESIGMIFLHDENKYDNYASMTIYIADNYRNRTCGLEAFRIYLKFLKNETKLRKLYFDIFEYNLSALKIINRVGFIKEGKFLKHRFYKNKYWTQFRYSIFLDDWEIKSSVKDYLVIEQNKSK